MEYFAGIFDAEGWISLIETGHFNIALEITNEYIINIFQEEFGGKTYIGNRENKKRTYIWKIATNHDEAHSFINKIINYTRVKTSQLNSLKEYLDQSREKRRENRGKYRIIFCNLKKPIPYTKDQLKVPTIIIPDESFFKWFAGFMDGDGNFTIFEYQDGPKRTFDSWIGAFNTFGEPIIHIQERINGSISEYKGTNYPVWKWVCNQNMSQFVCDNLYPHLIVKKYQCQLVSEYLKIHTNKIRGIDYSENIVSDIRNIIKQIKYHNSL